MALRDKLRDRVQPHLEPGETVHQVFMGQTGPSPYWVFLTYLTAFWNKYFIVAVTDRNVVTFRASLWRPSFVKEPVQMHRHPRNTQLGPMSGLWGKTTITGETVHVHKRFHKDVNEADAQIGAGSVPGATPAAAVDATAPTADALVDAAAAATPAGWYADPHGVAAQRYWDGQTWTEHTA